MMDFQRKNRITGIVLDCSITVHRTLGAGLMESVYEACLAHELLKEGLQVERQKGFPVQYDGITFDLGFRADLVVENAVLVEPKAVEKILPIHTSQTLTYMRLLGLELGLLINFHSKRLIDGFNRLRL